MLFITSSFRHEFLLQGKDPLKSLQPSEPSPQELREEAALKEEIARQDQLRKEGANVVKEASFSRSCNENETYQCDRGDKAPETDEETEVDDAEILEPSIDPLSPEEEALLKKLRFHHRL